MESDKGITLIKKTRSLETRALDAQWLQKMPCKCEALSSISVLPTSTKYYSASALWESCCHHKGCTPSPSKYSGHVCNLRYCKDGKERNEVKKRVWKSVVSPHSEELHGAAFVTNS